MSLKHHCLLILLAMLGLTANAHAQFAPPQRSVTLRVTEMQGSTEPLCDRLSWYMDVTLNGSKSRYQMTDYSVHNSGGPPFCPAKALLRESIDNVSKTRTQDVCLSEFDDLDMDFSIELFEHDNIGGDDTEANFSGTLRIDDPTTHQGCHYPGGGKGGFCWEFDVVDESLRDSDGDGIRDHWEANGLDVNCDGQLNAGEDLFFHQMGLSPTHKDVLVEVNWFEGYRPTTAVFDEMQRMFSEAPIGAGGVDNPDGQIGINVIIDAGEVMNNVGVHSLGGRTLGPAADSPNSSEELDAFMQLVEAQRRIGFFRQIILGPVIEGGVPQEHSAGRFVGNDRIQMENLDETTFIHEFGHALGLLHGGEKRDDGSCTGSSGCSAYNNQSTCDLHRFDGCTWEGGTIEPGFEVAGHNCKPNHLSLMNYNYGAAAGIPYETGALTMFFNDFAPSKIPDAGIIISGVAAAACPAGSSGCNRRLGLTPDLDETNLVEDEALLESDFLTGVIVRHQMIFSDSTGMLQTTPIEDGFDYDADPSTTLSGFETNIDLNPAFDGPQGCTEAVNGARTVLRNLDEWSRVDLAPGRGVEGNLAQPNRYWEDTHPPFTAELREEVRAMLTETDIAIAGSLLPEPVSTITPATLTIDIANQGRNRASGGFYHVTLPPGVLATEVPDLCTSVSARIYQCQIGYEVSGELRALPGYHSMGVSFTLEIAQNPTGEKRAIAISAAHQGHDPDFSNNTQVIEVVATPGFFGFDDPDRPWVVSWGNGSTVPTTTSNVAGGSYAAALDCGSVTIESPTFDTAELEIVGSELMMSVWVPSEQSPWWVGDVQAYLDAPSAGIWGQYLGNESLTNLPRDEWTPITVGVPEGIQERLLGDYPDARIRLQINVATCGAPVLFDSLQFIGELTERTVFHPSDEATVVSSSVLSFDHIADWSVSSGSGNIGPVTSMAIEGGGAVGFDPNGWARLESRTFSTTELQAVTSRLSFQIFIPDLPPDYYWLGQVNAHLNCPSAGVWNQYLGYHPLQILFDDEYNRIELDIPQHLVEVLQGDYDDCSFALDIASDQTHGTFILDAGGFAQ